MSKKIFAVLLTIIMILSLVACGVPSVEDNADDQRDEVSGDNMTGVGTNDVEFIPPQPEDDKDDTANTQKPNTDNSNDQPVEQDKDTEADKEEEKPPVHEEEDAPATTPDDSDSGSSKPNSDGSIGTTNVGGSVYRQFPDGYNVNSITPQKPFERVMIGNDEYLWDGSTWGVVDNTDPPNDYADLEGSLDENSPFN